MRSDRHRAFNLRAILSGLLITATTGALAGTPITTSDYAVQASAVVQSQPPQVVLSWPADTTELVTSYLISRRAPGTAAWTSLATLSGTATSFADTNVAVNGEYEYEIKKTAPSFKGYGYVLAGIEAPLEEDRGIVILIVDSSLAVALTTELDTLRSDLIGDGWQVLRHDVMRSDSPATVKALILADYQDNPQQVRSVFLLGHVPVPYSGGIFPDGHNPDHYGAWPADVYYADMDGIWTDSSLNSTVAASSRNWNVPGDGKFDNSYLPTTVELEVGRVDFADLPSLGSDEVTFLRRYLNKDHAFRHRFFLAERRGVIADNFGVSGGSAYAVNGWRNSAALFGAAAQTEIPAGSWFSALSTNAVLWAYGCGPGSYTTVSGVCSASDYASNDPGAVFTFLFGSYLGDWDSTDNVMRASLASPTYTLTVGWAGRPHWFVHPMAQGDTIGYCARLAQNNDGLIYRQLSTGTRNIHTALLGDPTLRLHPVAPPSGLIATVNSGIVTLSWLPSAETVIGYLVYRAETDAGPFVRLTSQTVADLAFVDDSPVSDTHVYLVRALKLESSGSGTYYNASQGSFVTATGINNGEAGINDPPVIGTLSTNTAAGDTIGSGDVGMTGGFVEGGTISNPGTLIPPETTDITETDAIPETSTPADTNSSPAPGLPTVTVTVVNPRVYESEDHPAMIKITRIGDKSAELRIPFTLSGTAINGVDYRFVRDLVTLHAGEGSAMVAIWPLKDRRQEPTETVVLTLSKGPDYALRRTFRAMVEISDQRPRGR